MKVVFLSDDFPPQSFGGAGISTYELALGMQKAGQEVFVITTCRKDQETGESDYQGLKVFRIKSDYPARWRAYVSLYNRPVVKKVDKLLKEIKPDVVHANNIHFHLSYRSLKIAKKYAMVVITFRDVMSFNFTKLSTERYLKHLDAHTTWLDHLKQAKKRWNPFRNIVIKHYLKYADKKFAVSYSLKKALEQNGIENVDVIHTGVEASDWHTSEHKYRDKKTIFLAGRLSEAKGEKLVKKAMEEVSKKYPEARLLKVGGENWITRDEMKMAYAFSDIVLVPSVIFDSLPRVVLEAMASAKPVIGTFYGGTKEVIEDGVTGYVINPFDIQGMVEKILDLLENPRKAEEFGNAGYGRIKKEFSLEKMVNKYLEAYTYLYENH